MNRATPIVLAVLCALLAAFILFFETEWQSTDVVVERAKRLYDIPAGEIDWLSIKNPADRVVIKKSGGKWKLEEPVELPADGPAVASFVRRLADLEFARQFDAPDIEKGLEVYGLVPPTVVLRARWDGEEIELRLGARTPTGTGVYAQTRKNVRRVYAIDAAILDILSRPASDWRSRELIDFDPERVEEIRLSGPSSKIRIERRGDRWFMKSPLSARASAARVRATITALDRAQIERFVADDDARLEDFGLREPRLTAHLEVRDGEDAEVQFGAPDPERPGAIFVRCLEASSIVSVSTNLLAGLEIKPEEFRDRQLIPVEAAAVERVVVTRAETRMEAIRRGGAWEIVRPGELETSPANDAAVSRFVRHCCGIQVAKFVADAVTDPAQLGLDEPSARVEFWTAAGSGPSEGRPEAGGRRLDATLLVGPPKDGAHNCVVDPEPFVLAITGEDFAPLQIEPWAWRSPTVWKLDGPVTAFSVRRGSAQCLVSRADGGWTAEPPGPIEPAAAAAAADILASLQARAWLGPDPPRTLDDPAVTFSIRDTAVLRIWQDGGRWIAWAEGGGAPNLFFELTPAEAQLLNHPIRQTP